MRRIKELVLDFFPGHPSLQLLLIVVVIDNDSTSNPCLIAGYTNQPMVGRVVRGSIRSDAGMCRVGMSGCFFAKFG